MELMHYLICIATRHEQAKSKHLDELRELHWHEKTGTNSKELTLTYPDEVTMLKGLIDSIPGIPACLSTLSPSAIVAFAHTIKARMSNDPSIYGHEIIDKLVCDPEQTSTHLTAFAELKEQQWIRLLESFGVGLTDQPPFCWLQSTIEIGDAFHREMNNSTNVSIAFISNDAYLDAVFAYLKSVFLETSDRFKIHDANSDLTTEQPDSWYRMIVQRVQASHCKLPSAEVQQKYRLSTYQYLALVGLLGTRNKDLNFDFNDPRDVTRLFATKRETRKRMHEHLYGTTSKLFSQRLIEATKSQFGERVQLTITGIRALIGKESCTSQELKQRISKDTLFEFEEPKVKKDSLMLPLNTTEALQSLLFSESKQGQRIRKSWHDSLPSKWGSPTGTTVLLYGPPGTGKTLTAQYLASELKRPLLKIDSSKILSCWVGESEQNVRKIFDDYATLHKELRKAPVLLLNEADQLLGSRGSGEHSVDRMNNNMQNLFLEGLERFSGIMVATTNRRDLLDAAFSRRFTYKLELPPPDKHLRMEIWKSHLPMEKLGSDVDIGTLAELNLSGGEIRLVIERAVRLRAYRGETTLDSATLSAIAHDELSSRTQNSSKIRIGF